VGIIFEVNYNDGTYGVSDQCAHTPQSSFPFCQNPWFQSVPNFGAITIAGSPTFPTRTSVNSVRHWAKPAVIGPSPAAIQNPQKWNPCYLINGDYTNDAHCDRSESEKAIPYSDGLTEWYAFSVYIDPATQYSNVTGFVDQNGQVIFQAHQLGGTCGSGIGPRFVIYFSKKNGQWTAINDTQNNNAAGGQCPSVALRTRNTYLLGAWTTGVWTDFVVQARWSTNPAIAFLKIWKDNVLVRDTTGLGVINSFNGHTQTDVKWGVYQSWWTVQNPPAGEQSIVYHNIMRVGDSGESFASMSTAPSAPSSAFRFRSTLSPLGTRTGSRQGEEE
jgi:hypothetical protein